MKNIRGVTFDAGGTLVRPFPSVGHIYSEVMAQHGLECDGEMLEAAFRRAWKNAQGIKRAGLSDESEKEWWKNLVRETLNGLDKPPDFDSLFEDLWSTFADSKRWKLYEGVTEVLPALKKRGYKIAVLSNWDKRLRSILNGLDIARYFDHIVISSEVGYEKPDPRIFKFTEEKLKMSGSEILHVGDSHYHDAEPARKAGWKWIVVHHHPELLAATESSVFSLAEVLEMLS